MLDASKAFDRLRYDNLYERLLNNYYAPNFILPIVIKALLDMYTRQKTQTAWNNNCSEYFGVQNGILQGGIMSPLIYTVYAICYVNDMQIMCGSVCVLQSIIVNIMVNIMVC